MSEDRDRNKREDAPDVEAHAHGRRLVGEEMAPQSEAELGRHKKDDGESGDDDVIAHAHTRR
jgi:hypothetical protein